MGSSIDRRTLRTWIEVDRRALRNNLAAFRRLLPQGCRLMAVCKSNAYGHGLYDMAPVLEEMGVDWFGVDSIVEAVSLRETGIKKPILALGYTLPSRFKDAEKYRVDLTISSPLSLRALSSYRNSRQIKIHLKLDTGMHRQGFLASEWPGALRFLRKNPDLIEVEGICTHFAAAKDPEKRAYTNRQIEEFEQGVAFFRKAGFSALRHACATAGAL
ncbi:MAG: alanine racemase, partial [Acidobacteriota bacterium]